MNRTAHAEAARLSARGVRLLLNTVSPGGPNDVLVFAVRRLCEAIEHLASAILWEPPSPVSPRGAKVQP